MLRHKNRQKHIFAQVVTVDLIICPLYIIFFVQGCHLSLVARNWEMLNRAAKKCSEAGAKSVFVAPHDVSSLQECEDVIRKTVDEFGGTVPRTRTVRPKNG